MALNEKSAEKPGKSCALYKALAEKPDESVDESSEDEDFSPGEDSDDSGETLYSEKPSEDDDDYEEDDFEEEEEEEIKEVA
jgi:hypothetical protein